MTTQRRARARSALVGTIVVVLAACGGDSTGPPAPSFNLTGGWLYDAILVSGGFQCTTSPISVQLTHNGRTLTGTYGALDFNCLGPGSSLHFIKLGAGQIRNGSVSGSAVSFEFGTTGWRNTGTALPGPAGQTQLLTGTLNATVNTGAPTGSVTFTNNSWRAVR